MQATFATYRVDKERIAYPPKRKAPKWIYRLFKKAHTWLGDFVNEPVEVSFKTTTIDFSKKFNGILEHAREIERTTGMRPKYLIVGRDAYFELAREVHTDYPFLMTFPSPPGSPDIMLGLTVIVVPWIDGMFCLPDLDRLIR